MSGTVCCRLPLRDDDVASRLYNLCYCRSYHVNILHTTVLFHQLSYNRNTCLVQVLSNQNLHFFPFPTLPQIRCCPCIITARGRLAEREVANPRG